MEEEGLVYREASFAYGILPICGLSEGIGSVSLELTWFVSPVEWGVWVEVLIALWGVCKTFMYCHEWAFVANSLPLVGNLSMALIHGSKLSRTIAGVGG